MTEEVIVPAVPAAPPVAPVTPPAAPAVPVEAPATPVNEPAPYEPATGSRQLDVALRHFVSELGLSPDSAEIQELLRTGNVRYIEGAASLQGKLDQLAPFLELANGGYSEVAEGKEKKDAELRTELEGFAGSKETFDAAIEFVKKGSTPEQLAEFSKALDMGGLVGRAMVEMFVRQMQGSPDVTVAGASAVSAAPGAAPPSMPAAYTDAASWRVAQRGLIAKYGLQQYATTPEGVALMAAFPRTR